jgi:hypothetical protein
MRATITSTLGNDNPDIITDIIPRSCHVILRQARGQENCSVISGLVSLPKPGLDFLMQCCTQVRLRAPFHEAEICLRDAEHLGRLDLRQAEHQPPAFEPLSEGRCGREGAGERSFMPGETLIRCANDLWGF